MNLFLRPKGTITSRFAGIESYRETPHDGIDFQFGFKKPHHAVADGVIYKIKGKNNIDPQQYRIIYQLCETPLGPMEVAYVHCLDILVAVGDLVEQGQPIMTEGNTGTEVYSEGIKVLREEKPSGKGSHLHLSVRPVEKVLKTVKGDYYLEDLKGKPYKDKNGNFYKIKNKDNGSKGWVNYEQWLFVPSNKDYFDLLSGVLTYVRSLLK